MGRIPIEPGLITFPEGDTPELLGCRCDACGTVFHPARPVCLACHGRQLSEMLLSGNGTLYACTHVAMRLRPGLRESRGYWVAQVDLDEGPRVQGILSPELTAPRVGMRLRLGIETLRVDDDKEIVVHHFGAAGENS
jgi:uncharacterized OB-fold protein